MFSHNACWGGSKGHVWNVLFLFLPLHYAPTVYRSTKWAEHQKTTHIHHFRVSCMFPIWGNDGPVWYFERLHQILLSDYFPQIYRCVQGVRDVRNNKHTWQITGQHAIWNSFSQSRWRQGATLTACARHLVNQVNSMDELQWREVLSSGGQQQRVYLQKRSLLTAPLCIVRQMIHRLRCRATGHLSCNINPAWSTCLNSNKEMGDSKEVIGLSNYSLRRKNKLCWIFWWPNFFTKAFYKIISSE